MQTIRKQYGWIICIASTLLLFCTGGLCITGFGAYQPFIIEHGGLSNTESSTLFLVRTLFMLGGLAVVNRLIRLLEIRRTITIALILSGVGFVVFGFANSFLMYCAGMAMVGFSFGIGGMVPASVLIARWFEEHRGLALGLCMASTGLSSLAASPFIIYMTGHHSLRISFLSEAVFMFVAAVIVWLIVRSMPECLDTHPIGEHQLHDVQMYAKADAPAPLYAGMLFGVFLLGSAGTNYTPHLSVLYSTCGYDSGAIAAFVSIYGLSLAFGKCFYGFLVDLIGTFRASLLLYAFAITGTGLTCLADHAGLWTAYLGICFTGLGYAIITVSISVYSAGMSTEANYAKTVSRMQLACNLGNLVFAAVPGILADQTGSYIPSFFIMFLMTCISGLLLSIMYRLILRGC